MTQTSVEIALQQALLRLLKEQPLSKLNVKAVCREAAVARSSFYVYYQNLLELLEAVEDRLVGQIAELDEEITDTRRIAPADFAYFSNLLQFMREHAEVVRVLLIDQPDPGFVVKWRKAIEKHLRTRARRYDDSPEFALLLQMASAQAIAGFAYLLDHPGSVPDEYVYRIISATLKNLGEL